MNKLKVIILLTVQTQIIFCPAEFFDFKKDHETEASHKEDTRKIPSVRERAAIFDQNFRQQEKEPLVEKKIPTKTSTLTDQGLKLEIDNHINTARNLSDSIRQDLHSIQNLQSHYTRISKLINLPESQWSTEGSKTAFWDQLNTNPIGRGEETTSDRQEAKKTNKTYISTEEESKFYDQLEKLGKARKIMIHDSYDFQNKNNIAKQYTSDKTFSTNKFEEIHSSISNVKENLDTIHNSFEKLANIALTQDDIDQLQKKLKSQKKSLMKIKDPKLQSTLLETHTKSEELVTKMQDAFIKQTINNNDFETITTIYNSLTEEGQTQLAEQIYNSGNKRLIRKFENWE